jgi:sugar transferase
MPIKVSFVVPAYNAGKYIKKCVQSILNQSLKEIELIVINDGSSDNTLEILSLFNDNRLKMVSQHNAGPSAARNNGIRICEGKYIILIDADDFVEPNYAERAYEIALKFDADIVVTDMFKDYIGGVKLIKDYAVPEVVLPVNKNDYFSKLIFAKGVLHNLVNKLIRAEILKKTPFPNGIFLAEDFDTYIKVVAEAKRIIKLNEAFYHYRIGQNNTSGFESLKGVKDHKFVYDDVMEFLRRIKKDDPRFIEMLEYRKIKGVYLPVLSSKPDLSNQNYVEGLNIVFSDLDEIVKLGGFKRLRMKYKILFWLLKRVGDREKAAKFLYAFNRFKNIFSGKKMKNFRA